MRSQSYATASSPPSGARMRAGSNGSTRSSRPLAGTCRLQNRICTASAATGSRKNAPSRRAGGWAGLPPSRRVATFTSGDHTWVVQGPEVWALTGPNGSGKTTLLRQLVHPDTSPAARLRPRTTCHVDHVGYLPQRPDVDLGLSPLELVAQVAPLRSPAEIRNELARFLLRGDAATRAVGTLSGGERFRAMLARVLLAQPIPELLVLDEPTNDIDLDTKDHLVQALNAYEGAIIVVSHERAFLKRIHIDAELHLDTRGTLTASH